ncbi:hypothetical protein RY966_002368 [Enterobacter kobei]|nr:hypothetical protein [Enterobacter kobei]
MNTQLAFHNTQFNVVSRHNSIYLTAVEIAQALGYKKSDAVTQIYERNSDEFSGDMSETLNLSVSGNLTKAVRIFSLRGAHLIAMFARTPVAKEFRRWVLDILDREVGEPVAQPVRSTPSTEWTEHRPGEIYAFCDDYANRAEIIYYQDFKPIFSRALSSRDIVITPDGMMEWLERQGLVFFTLEELKNMTVQQLLAVAR